MKPACPSCLRDLTPIKYRFSTYEDWRRLGERMYDYHCEHCDQHVTAAQVVERCDHNNFESFVAVNRLEDSGRFQMDIRVRCRDCGMPFRFLGVPCGLDLNSARVSFDGTELRAAIGTDTTISKIKDTGGPTGFAVSSPG